MRIDRTAVSIVATAAILVVNLAAVPLAHGADLKKQAEKQLAEASQQAVEDFKAETKIHRIVLDAALDEVDTILDDEAASMNDVVTVFNALETFQAAIKVEIAEANDEFHLDRWDWIEQLADGGIAPSDYPKGFQHGAGGTSDRFPGKLDAAIAKLYETVETRVRKTAKKFEGEAGIALRFRLAPPFEVRQFVESDTAAVGNFGFPLTIDLVVAASELEFENDGVIVFAGTAASSDGLLTIEQGFENGVSLLGFATATASGRWSSFALDKAEGSYGLLIRHPNDVSGSAYTTISVR